MDFYEEATRRVGELPGVEGVAFGSFASSRDAGIALLVAVVGVAGVLAFSVSARTRELGRASS